MSKRIIKLKEKKWTLNGEPIEIHEFLIENQESLTKEDLGRISSLPKGNSITFGGGASPEQTLKRVK